MKLVKACIAMAAFAAVFVLPSVASATPPTLCETTEDKTCSTVPVGTNIVATNVAHGAETKTETVMTSSLGEIKCTTATITGKVIANGGGHVLGTVETAEFRRTAGSATDTSHCTAPGGLGTITATPSHSTNPCHTPTGGTSHCSLPWCITAGKENQFELWGEVEGSCTNGKKRAVTFTIHSSVLGACSYSKAVVIGTYTTHPSDAILTINKEKFDRITGSGFCPSDGTLDMAFTLTTDETPHSTAKPLFIT